ncbi:MAG: ABC transporter ATP-binding protein [Armatimonadetes bacterium]|nr:ABC transporter ATP-binding protein [Armatimonadota bacterium]
MMMPVSRAEDVPAVMRRLWQYLRRYRSSLLLVAALVAVSTVLTLINPYLISRAIDRCIIPREMDALARIVALMIGIHILSAVTTWLQTVMMIRVSQSTLRDIRGDIFRTIQTLPLRFFDRQTHGEIMSRLTNDTEAVNQALAQTVTQLMSSVLSVVGAICFMFALNWRMALVTLATAPLAFLFSHVIAAASRRKFRERQADLGDLNGLIEENITGQRVVKAFAREQRAIQDFDRANEKLRRSATAAGMISGVMGPAMNLARNITFAVLATAGGWIVLHDLATIGTVAAFVNYAHFVTMPINQIAMLWGMVQSAIAGAERVFGILDEPPETPDAPRAVALETPRGDVTFDRVSFGYDPEHPVLKDVSFHAEAGQTIALVGPTGAGKTTIINLLTRFYDVDEGAIRVDGHDLREIRRCDLRRALGIVLQDTFLFATTVRENIRYGRPGATDSEVEQAAELANAASFIRRLPHGFDTELTEDGGSLSQGQRQLLAIARAILADPAILILDEATSSVDTRTEIHIQDAMLRLMHGRTAFVIAHRLSTIRQADCILVVDGGQIVERGTHAELMAARGAYWRLHNLQYGAISGEDRLAAAT